MAEYHVGTGICAIYAGTLNKNKTMWRNKSDVTVECLSASADYLISNKKEFHFEWRGKQYAMRIELMKEGEQDENQSS